MHSVWNRHEKSKEGHLVRIGDYVKHKEVKAEVYGGAVSGMPR